MSQLAPSIFDINSLDTSNAVGQDTTLTTDATDNSDAGGGSGLADVLNNLIRIAPSLLILSKTPTAQLPRVTGSPSQPILKPPATTFSSTELMTMFIILIMIVGLIFIFGKRS